MCNPPKRSDSSEDKELDRSDVAAAAMFTSRFDQYFMTGPDPFLV